MKFKAIKYNKDGLTRAENTAPKFVMPKNDLNKSNVKIVVRKNYLSVLRKGDK